MSDCPHCGGFVPEWADICPACGEAVRDAGAPDISGQTHGRKYNFPPVGVLIAALCVSIVGILFDVVGVIAGHSAANPLGSRPAPNFLIFLIYFTWAFLGALLILLSVGLFRLRNWARIATLILNGIYLVLLTLIIRLESTLEHSPAIGICFWPDGPHGCSASNTPRPTPPDYSSLLSIFVVAAVPAMIVIYFLLFHKETVEAFR